MEGNTYDAKWKKQGENFLVYLVSDKTFKGSDIDFDTACEDLCLKICEEFGDGEAILNLLREPPQPEGASKYANPALVTLSWNEAAVGQKWQKNIYENGYCSACKAGMGKRTSELLKVDKFPKGNIGDFEQVMYSPVLLSSEFVSLLTKKEIKNLGLQEVLATRSKKKFYEVNGTPVLKQVGVKGAQYNHLSSWQCISCGYRSFSCNHPEMPDNYKFSNFCCIDDLPENCNEAFVIEDNIGRHNVCMSLRRWNKLKSLSQTKGITVDRLYVIPKEQADREPKVRIEANAN